MLSRRGFLGACVGAAGAAVAPVGWYGAFYERGNLEVVRRTMSVPNLPARLDGLTAVQVSDLHLVRTTDLHVRMVELVQALNPDLVFVTGDLVDDHSAVGEVVDLLRNLSPPRGLWAVAGNWDHTAEAVDLLDDALSTAGMHFLVDEARQLDDGLWLVGVDDPSTGNDNLNDAVAQVPARANKLLLAHSPEIVHSLDNRRFDLVLAGHTHGGQVNLPMINGGWTKEGPTRRYLEGLFNVKGSRMYVNRGIGTTHVPIRIGARPEITHFTFRGS